MNVGEIWYVRNKANHSPTVDLVEILYLNGNVVGFGDECYDIRLLDFVERDYEEEERRAQEKFMDALSKHERHGQEEGTLTTSCEDGVVYPDTKQTYMPAVDFGPDAKICSINTPYSYSEPEQVESTPTKLSWWTRLKVWWITHAY